MPAEKRAASPWGLPGSYDPKRRTHLLGRRQSESLHAAAAPWPPRRRVVAAPADAYSNSTVAIDIETGKLRWYYQELPGDDWDADHNQERLLLRTRVNPDPKHVKWIQPTCRATRSATWW